jgi:hypothetical protein
MAYIEVFVLSGQEIVQIKICERRYNDKVCAMAEGGPAKHDVVMFQALLENPQRVLLSAEVPRNGPTNTTALNMLCRYPELL